MRTLLVISLLAGCGGSASEPAAPDAPPAVDAGDGWQTLLARSWQIEQGVFDQYRCSRAVVPEDVFIGGFRARSPAGTHHTVLTVSEASGEPVGDYDCQAGNLDLQMLYAAGVGTDDVLFPPGKAVRLRAGDVIHINLHLFNATDGDLAGESGVDILPVAADQVTDEVEMVFAGTDDLVIPGNGQTVTATGGCTVTQPYTILALWPHMHQLATAQKIEHAPSGGGFATLLDTPYNFDEQKFYPRDPLPVAAGDQLRVTCSYVNDTGQLVGFGDSSNSEMCFTGIYRFPTLGTHLFECVQ